MSNYYWDGSQLRKKDQLLSDLLLSLNYIQKEPPPAPPSALPTAFNSLLNLSRCSLLSSTSPTLLGEAFYTRKSVDIWEKFNAFLSKIAVSAEDNEIAVHNAEAVIDVLNSHYYSILSFNKSNGFIVGSYYKKTAISPPTDVDLLYILPDSVFYRFEGYKGNKQSALLQEIKAKLLQTYSRTDMRADGQVVQVNFTSLNVEVVPCFRAKNGGFIIPDTNSDGQWKKTSPVDELRVLDEADTRSKGNVRNLIRMLKVWRSVCNVEIKSLVLELRAENFLKGYQYFDKGTVYYDWILRDFFGQFVKYSGGNCVVPGTEEKCLYGDSWKSKVEAAYSTAMKACELESSGKKDESSREWRKIFGDKFPL